MPPLDMLQPPQPQMNPMDQMGGQMNPQILMMILQAILGGVGGAPQGDMPVMATNLPPNDPTGGDMGVQKLAALRAQGLI